MRIHIDNEKFEEACSPLFIDDVTLRDALVSQLFLFVNTFVNITFYYY